MIRGVPPDGRAVFIPQAESVDTQERATHVRQKQQMSHRAAQFNAAETEEKVVLSFVPTPFTTVIMAKAMPAAMRAYSMAVAQFSTFNNQKIGTAH